MDLTRRCNHANMIYCLQSVYTFLNGPQTDASPTPPLAKSKLISMQAQRRYSCFYCGYSGSDSTQPSTPHGLRQRNQRGRITTLHLNTPSKQVSINKAFSNACRTCGQGKAASENRHGRKCWVCLPDGRFGNTYYSVLGATTT